jgi:hypothetical protein
MLSSRNGGEPCARSSTPDKLTPTQGERYRSVSDAPTFDGASWIDQARPIADVCERPIEWKLSANSGQSNGVHCRVKVRPAAAGLPSAELVDRLLKLDSKFWVAEFPPGSGKKRAQSAFVLPG